MLIIFQQHGYTGNCHVLWIVRDKSTEHRNKPFYSSVDSFANVNEKNLIWIYFRNMCI